jgi:hypothetical protein
MEWGVSVTPGRFLPPGKTQYPLYRRLGGPQGRFRQVRKISPPPGFDPRTVQPVASRYTDWATWPLIHTLMTYIFWKGTAWQAHLHRFKIIESPECPCDGGNQTVDHLIYDCTKLQRERERLICSVSKLDSWSVNKSDLVNKHIKHFIHFANSIDFEKLWEH